MQISQPLEAQAVSGGEIGDHDVRSELAESLEAHGPRTHGGDQLEIRLELYDSTQRITQQRVAFDQHYP